MTRVIRSEDCGNSPKNQLVEELAVALSIGDYRTVSRLVTEDARWTIVGGETLSGREAILQVLERKDGDPITTLTVRHVMSHGKSGAVNGTIEYQAAGQAFCHVVEFGSAKGTSISSITSYLIDV